MKMRDQSRGVRTEGDFSPTFRSDLPDRGGELPPGFQTCPPCPDVDGWRALGSCSAAKLARAREATGDDVARFERARIAGVVDDWAEWIREGKPDGPPGNLRMHPHAEAQADRTLEQLKDGLAAGVTIEVPEEPPEHSKRLLNTLGADYVVKKERETMDKKPRGYWTRERIIEAIQLWAEQHDGQPPTSQDWGNGIGKTPPGWPAYSTVRNKFGTWTDAIEAAGFQTFEKTGKPASRTPRTPRRQPAETRVPAPATQPPVANGQPGSYANRARAVLEAAELVDEATAALADAQEAYAAALEAARA